MFHTYVCKITSGRSNICLGILLPQRNCATSSEKWLQLCFNKSYEIPLKVVSSKPWRYSLNTEYGTNVSPNTIFSFGSPKIVPPWKHTQKKNNQINQKQFDMGTKSRWEKRLKIEILRKQKPMPADKNQEIRRKRNFVGKKYASPT